MKLRPYQEKAVKSIYDWFETGGDAPLIVTPTGSGKSVILAEFIRGACNDHPGTKVLVVTHVKELVAQDYNKIMQMWPTAPAGIYSAGLGRRELRPITVASIQSIYNKPQFHGRFDLIIIDEAHLIPHKSEGMYRELLESSARVNPDVRLIGLTATPYRLKAGTLYEGEGALFDGVSYEIKLPELIQDGYLSALTSKNGGDIDLSTVSITAGEFNQKELSERMSAIDLIDHHVGIILERCKDRNSLLIFSVTVEHAVEIKAALQLKGVACDYVSGDMTRKERDDKINAFKAGRLRALVNCAILTTGFDHPETDAVIIIRPTMSAGLFCQMVGRGFRPVYAKEMPIETKEERMAAIAAGPKPNCLILDFGGNFQRHGPIDLIQPQAKKKAKAGAEPPSKTCPECSEVCHPPTKFCPSCGFAFEIKEREAETQYHKGAVTSLDLPKEKKVYPPEWFDVKGVQYSKHESKSGAMTMKVTYFCGLRSFSEYICVEHSGFAREKAIQWWAFRHPSIAPPTADLAISAAWTLEKPKRIRMDFNEQFPKIIEASFKTALELGQERYGTKPGLSL